MRDALARWGMLLVVLPFVVGSVSAASPAVAGTQGPDEPGMIAFSSDLHRDRPRVDLVLFDGVALSDRMSSTLRDEVEAVFAGVGVELGWVDRLEDPMQPLRHPEVKIILIDGSPAAWGIRERVMGMVHGTRHPEVAVYVFYPAVVRTVTRYPAGSGFADWTREMGRDSSRIATALARVIAHEVFHVFAPGREHAPSGLMQQRQAENDLLVAEVKIDAGFVAAFHDGLQAAMRRQRSMDSPAGGGRSRGRQ